VKNKLLAIHKRLRGVAVLNRDWKEVVEKYDSERTLFYCLPSTEKVIRSDYFIVCIGDIKKGDLLANRNEVKAVFRRKASEEIVKFTFMGLGKDFPVRCSKDHKVLVYKDGNVFYKKAEELMVGDLVVINTDNEVYVEIPEYVNKKIKNGVRKKSYFRKDKLFELCKFIGYYIAEGHKHNGLIFSFNVKEIEYCKEVANLALDIFGIEAKIYEKCPHSSVSQVYVFGRDLEEWFDLVVFGRKACEKELAPWVMKLPPEYQLEILRYWLRGDGGLWVYDEVEEKVKFRRSWCRNKYKITGTTCSEKLAWQLYHIALRCKLHPCIKKRQNNFDIYFTAKEDVERILKIKINGRSCKRRYWVDGVGLVTPITSIKFEHFEGEMVDISTEKGNFIHQSGIVMHNCDPPYVLSTRSGSEGIYAKEMSDKEHEELVDVCLRLKGKVILSGYRNKIYERLEKHGWIRLDKEVCMHAPVVLDGQEKGKRVESVWLNYKVGRWLV